eukprot:scaffold22701_cov74-Phaeocystis_antarctica.AAC.3
MTDGWCTCFAESTATWLAKVKYGSGVPRPWTKCTMLGIRLCKRMQCRELKQCGSITERGSVELLLSDSFRIRASSMTASLRKGLGICLSLRPSRKVSHGSSRGGTSDAAERAGAPASGRARMSISTPIVLNDGSTSLLRKSACPSSAGVHSFLVTANLQLASPDDSRDNMSTVHPTRAFHRASQDQPRHCTGCRTRAPSSRPPTLFPVRCCLSWSSEWHTRLTGMMDAPLDVSICGASVSAHTRPHLDGADPSCVVFRANHHLFHEATDALQERDAQDVRDGQHTIASQTRKAGHLDVPFVRRYNGVRARGVNGDQHLVRSNDVEVSDDGHGSVDVAERIRVIRVQKRNVLVPPLPGHTQAEVSHASQTQVVRILHDFDSVGKVLSGVGTADLPSAQVAAYRVVIYDECMRVARLCLYAEQGLQDGSTLIEARHDDEQLFRAAARVRLQPPRWHRTMCIRRRFRHWSEIVLSTARR